MQHFDSTQIDQAAAILRAGGVLAYPTEGVYGLGCDPDNRAAFEKIFAIKRRPAAQGVLLIAADFTQVADWISTVPESVLERARAIWPGAHTLIFPASARVPAWVRGEHAGVALRVTSHPPAAALCRSFGGPIVSTSANRHGGAPALSAAEVGTILDNTPDGVLDAPLGGLDRPTPITDAMTGAIIRA
jgi:L-threonylcarbamoyladenylate synthase